MSLFTGLLLHPFATVAPATCGGALAVAVNCSWPMQRGRRLILMLQSLAAALFGLHYLLLGAPTAAALNVMGVIQAVSAATIHNRTRRLGVFVATIVASLVITAATFAGATSVLAQSGALVSAFGRLQRGAQAIRWCFLGSEVFWVTHNLLVGSRWGLTADALAVTMLVIGLARGGAPTALRARTAS